MIKSASWREDFSEKWKRPDTASLNFNRIPKSFSMIKVLYNHFCNLRYILIYPIYLYILIEPSKPFDSYSSRSTQPKKCKSIFIALIKKPFLEGFIEPQIYKKILTQSRNHISGVS